jgi:phage terminase large subunit-like protein
MSALALYHLKVGGRRRQMITISTAGLNEDSPLGALRARAHALPNFKRSGVVNTAVDSGFAWLEWCLTEDDDRTDIKLVKKANPASWHTLESLRRRLESPSMTPGRWARFACGVWTGSEDPWLTASEWDALAVDIGGLSEGEKVWAAVSAGRNPAIALSAPREDGAVVYVEIGDGDVPLERIEARIAELAKTYDLAQVCFDRVEFQRSAELLEAAGVAMVEIPHSPERLSIVTLGLHRLIQQGELHHDGDRALRGQVLGAVTKETERGWRLVKGDGSRGLVAMAFAVFQATQVAHPPRRPRIHMLKEA